MTRLGPIPVGLSIASAVPPSNLRDAYDLIERGGFSEIWVHEDYFFHGGFAAAATALQATRSIPVGIGIISALVRHPAVTAMEIATLAGIHPGRLRVGIGHGAPFWMKQLGLYPKSPLQSLRETTTTVRRLLAGESVTQSGQFALDAVQLAYPAPEVPLYTGVIGPKSLALSGEIADGTVVSVMAGPKYIEQARVITDDAAANAGRGFHALPTLAFCFVDSNGKAARAIARSVIAQMFALAGPDSLTDVYGINGVLTDMITRGGAATIEAEMPDIWIDWFAVAGDPDQCAERIRDLAAAGATSVVLSLSDPETLTPSIKLLAREVLSQVL